MMLSSNLANDLLFMKFMIKENIKVGIDGIDNKNKNGKKIILTNEVYELVGAEVAQLREKGNHFKVNETKLVNVLLELFFAKYLVKEREILEGKFFNKKAYLKMLIDKSATEDDLSNSLNEFIQKTKVKKERLP